MSFIGGGGSGQEQQRVCHCIQPANLQQLKAERRLKDMKAQIIHDSQGNILGVINLATLATDKGVSAYVPNPGEHQVTVDLTKEQADKPLDLLHTMRVNTQGAHAVLEPISKSKPK